MPGPNAPYTQLDANQVIQQAFDESSDRLRVDASVTASIGDIVINAEESDIALKDRITDNMLRIESDGSINVNVNIDAAGGDNIALSNEDGSKKVTVTTISGKNALDVNVVSSNGISTPSIQNVAMSVTPGTQSSVTFPATTKKVILKARGNSKLQYSFINGQTNTTFITIFPGNEEVIDNLSLTASLTIYIQASKASEILEVCSWT